MKNKKGAMGLDSVYSLVVFLVLIGIVLALGIVVLTKMGASDGINGTTGETAINDSVSSLAEISSTWMPVIIIVVIAVIILGLIMFLRGGSGKR